MIASQAGNVTVSGKAGIPKAQHHLPNLFCVKIERCTAESNPLSLGRIMQALSSLNLESELSYGLPAKIADVQPSGAHRPRRAAFPPGISTLSCRMNLETLIAPTDLRDYAKAHGWTLIKEAAKDRLYVMSHPNFERRQLVFPMDTTAPDYAEAINLMVEKIAVMERRTPDAIIKSLLEVSDDSVAFRVTSPRPEERYLPLAFAGAMVAGAQQLLLASACTVLKPKAHHPRLSRTEAQQFLETARFRHTQPGSFVLNVSCPVQVMDVQAPLLPGELEAPFVRRAMLALQRALRELVSAIETDSLDGLIATLKASVTPLVSSNFCEALTRFEDESLKNSLDVGITWAASIPCPAGEPACSAVRVQHDYFSRIEEVRRELRSNERHTEDTFIGTVERLDGEM
ncbi:MAG: hypothetical protein NTW21_19730 [Verrucomicrobia bacterium]|nr:hypothetical protein [Verrucomicrobiota bacterium]